MFLLLQGNNKSVLICEHRYDEMEEEDLKQLLNLCIRDESLRIVIYRDRYCLTRISNTVHSEDTKYDLNLMLSPDGFLGDDGVIINLEEEVGGSVYKEFESIVSSKCEWSAREYMQVANAIDYLIRIEKQREIGYRFCLRIKDSKIFNLAAVDGQIYELKDDSILSEMVFKNRSIILDGVSQELWDNYSLQIGLAKYAQALKGTYAYINCYEDKDRVKVDLVIEKLGDFKSEYNKFCYSYYGELYVPFENAVVDESDDYVICSSKYIGL